jgi:hypothetical protein
LSFTIPKAVPGKVKLFLILALLLSFELACNFNRKNNTEGTPVGAVQKFQAKREPDMTPRRLDGYTVRGFKFSYYLIPSQLGHEELIAVAQEIHDQEPDTQLILVDDDSQVAEYIAYAKEISKGNRDAKMPKEWAQDHIVGNVQKYLSGKWMLCESNGYREIAELK